MTVLKFEEVDHHCPKAGWNLVSQRNHVWVGVRLKSFASLHLWINVLGELVYNISLYSLIFAFETCLASWLAFGWIWVCIFIVTLKIVDFKSNSSSQNQLVRWGFHQLIYYNLTLSLVDENSSTHSFMPSIEHLKRVTRGNPIACD